jgi:general secretion pathway protein J
MRRRKDAGFTLVELLVVVALFGLISVMLLGGFRFATRAVTRGTLFIDRAAEFGLAADVLRRQLGDAQPLPARGGTDATLFDGTRDGLTFASLPPAYLAAGGWHRLEVRVEQIAGRRALTLGWRLIDADTAPMQRPSVLIADIAGADFAYFGATASETVPDWHDRWSGRDGLPMLIRVRIHFADGVFTPDVIVAVRPAAT